MFACRGFAVAHAPQANAGHLQAGLAEIDVVHTLSVQDLQRCKLREIYPPFDAQDRRPESTFSLRVSGVAACWAASLSFVLPLTARGSPLVIL